MSPERCAATSIAPRPTGSTSPFSAPTAVRTAPGSPTTRTAAVETTMKPTMSCGARRSNPGLSVRTNDTEVYADPTTDVAAAAHLTAPKSRKPAFPPPPRGERKPRRGGIARIERAAVGHDAERGEKEHDPHHRRHADAGDGGAGRLRNHPGARDAAVEQPGGTRERDVASHRSPHDGDHRSEERRG